MRMPGDGVSLPTTLAQMSTVAKTQARAQQAAPQVTPFSEQNGEQEELKIQRVKESGEAEKNKVTADGQEQDKRKRRRLNRRRKELGKEEDTAQSTTGTDDANDQSDESLGVLIDLRV